MKKNTIANAFNAPRKVPPTSKGYAGYDNARENIDPHLKTKVINSKEGTIDKVPVNNNDIANKLYVDNSAFSGDVESISTSFTAGSIAFSDGSNLAQDNANFFWDDGNNRLGIGTATPACGLNVKDKSILFEGVTGDTPTSGAGTRLMWIPSKGAFRAAATTATHMDAAVIGLWSTAFGHNTQCGGMCSVAFGRDTLTTGAYALGSGYATFIYGTYGYGHGLSSRVDTGATDTWVMGSYLRGLHSYCKVLGTGVNGGSKLTTTATQQIIMAINTNLFTFRVNGGAGTGTYGSLTLNGNTHLNLDDQELQFGTAKDATIIFDGSKLNIKPNAITATDVLTLGDGGTTDYVEIDGTGDVNFVGGAGLCFGSCTGNAIGWTQASAAQNTWYDISDADMASDPLNDVTHDGNGQLTVLKAGMYAADLSGSFEANAANVHIEVTFSINGTETTNGLNTIETQSANTQHTAAGVTILDLAANDTVNVSIRTIDAGTPDLAIDNLMLRLIQIGGT